jgi:hypothetical protein
MTNGTIELLDFLITPSEKRIIRQEKLLKSPYESNSDWYFDVPPCFNQALDICQTERITDGKLRLIWTQGSAFSFQAGDTLYSHCNVYGCCWREALKKMTCCVSILEAESATPQNKEKPRNPGKVVFKQYSVDRKTNQLREEYSRVEMTQDDFVRFLIKGPSWNIGDQ